ncbi:MAG: zinc ribbon domain-containing protein [Myxococcales bacterium]|nr:zinc ribbon domain-containing protein [Myxococcales bacterium]
MPIYEYQCSECGHRFERLVRIGADAPPCPECSAEVRKLISQSGFILKGGGWYKDHYGLKSSGSSSSSSDSSSSDSSSSSSASSSDSSSSSSDSSSSSSSSDSGSSGSGGSSTSSSSAAK